MPKRWRGMTAPNMSSRSHTPSHSMTLLVKSRPLNFQEHRRALLHTAATVSNLPLSDARSPIQGIFELTNRVIISFTLVRMLADCVGASKYCNTSITPDITLEPRRRLHHIVASAY